MPTSEHDLDDTLLPETPDGYAPPVEFRYPVLVLLAIVAVVVPIAFVGFATLLGVAQGDAFTALLEYQETPDGYEFTIPPAVAATVVATIVVVTVLHELVHGLVFRLHGYDVSYGAAPQLGAFYAAAFHQFVPRNETIRSGLAPLVVLDALMLPLLFVPVPLLAVAAFVGLLLNTAGAAGDLYITARLLAYPPGTLTYDVDMRHMYVFVPEE